MPNTIKKSTLGFAILISGIPASAAEFDEMAGETGACLSDAVDNVIYRNYLSNLRPEIVKAAEKEFGIPRKSEKVGDSEIFEKDKTFIDRLVKVEGVSQPALNELAQRVADSRPFSVQPSVSGGRIAKRYLDQADEVIAHVDNNAEGDYTKFIANITARNPGFLFTLDADGAPSRESIGHALKTEEDRAKRESSNSLLS